jgi:hypothetical protein
MKESERGEVLCDQLLENLLRWARYTGSGPEVGGSFFLRCSKYFSLE